LTGPFAPGCFVFVASGVNPLKRTTNAHLEEL
jgi:hypothetical protein